MTKPQDLPPSQRWARLRFAVIGNLLGNPPKPGDLHATITALSEQTWTHPITGQPIRFSISTIERWYYLARHHQQPTTVLMRHRRCDAGKSRCIDPELEQVLRTSYQEHSSWTYLLHYDNAIAAMSQDRQQHAPSYTAVRRFMRQQGLIPRHLTADRHDTPAALATRHRFDHFEVRRFEHDHTHILWHTDAHHGRLSLSYQGQMKRPVLIALLDDHSRFIIHAQWFWHETAAAAAHVLRQGIAKMGLPRMLLSDNGKPFVADEIRDGLHRLGILHEKIMCYAPNQNGKMEVFWALVESRLIAMLTGVSGLDLYRLNELTHAWIQHDYNRRHHAGIGCTPCERFQNSPHVGRPAPDTRVLTYAFTRREERRQRRSDGSIVLGGQRFNVPSQYRHLQTLIVRYASWDLDHVFLAHPETDELLVRLMPVDLHGNAAGGRRQLEMPQVPITQTIPPPLALPPLLQAAMAKARMDGHPPDFLTYSHDSTSPSST